MNSNIFFFLFLAASPFLFMPSIIAWLTRNPRKILILIGNLVVWLFGFISVRSILQSSGGLFVPVPLDLLAWLALLVFAIRNPASSQDRDQSEGV